MLRSPDDEIGFAQLSQRGDVGAEMQLHAEPLDIAVQ
jgi:hypothetical protein